MIKIITNICLIALVGGFVCSITSANAGIAATVVVCSTDSFETNNCDYVCDGVDDQVEIQAAIDAVETGQTAYLFNFPDTPTLAYMSGQVQLSEGTFVISNTITIGSYTVLSGIGSNQTRIRGGSSSAYMANPMITNKVQTYTPPSSYGNSYAVIQNLFLDGQYVTTDVVSFVNMQYFKIMNCDINSRNPATEENSDTATIWGLRYMAGTDDGCVDTVFIQNCRFWHNGARIQSSYAHIVNNDFIEGFYGLYLRSAAYASVTNNIFEAQETKALSIRNSADVSIANNTFHHGNDVTPSAYGIYLRACNRVQITGNNIGANAFGLGKEGIISDASCTDVTVIGNNFYNCGLSSNTYSAIKLTGGAETRWIIANNIITHRNSTDANRLKYGIWIYPASTEIHVKDNIIKNCITAAIVPSAGTIVRGNPDYITENSGTATLTAGQTSVEVTHRMDTTPTMVTLTPTTDTAGKRYWVSAKTATTFAITIDSTNSSDISFDWMAVTGQSNFINTTSTIAVDTGNTTTIPPMSMYGRVTGEVQAGVTINLYQVSCTGANLVATTVTNAEGFYIFNNLDGFYNVEASYSGCSFDPQNYTNISPQNVSDDFVSTCP